MALVAMELNGGVVVVVVVSSDVAGRFWGKCQCDFECETELSECMYKNTDMQCARRAEKEHKFRTFSAYYMFNPLCIMQKHAHSPVRHNYIMCRTFGRVTNASTLRE